VTLLDLLALLAVCVTVLLCVLVWAAAATNRKGK
jgi:hypothetical protein